MERGDRAPLGTFVAASAPTAGATLALDEDAAHHARVKRLAVGDVVRVVDGRGTRAEARIVRLTKGALDVHVEGVERVAAPPPIRLLVPVADRDRMLWLAEKSAELGIAAWHPVRFRRSRSVSPRGEGAAFAAKVRARMAAALEQSGAAWLPELHAEREIDDAVRIGEAGARWLMDAGGTHMLGAPPVASEGAVVVGPEGGMEPDEIARFVDAGWRRVALGHTTLRFETAAIAAVAVLRAALDAHDPHPEE